MHFEVHFESALSKAVGNIGRPAGEKCRGEDAEVVQHTVHLCGPRRGQEESWSIVYVQAWGDCHGVAQKGVLVKSAYC